MKELKVYRTSRNDVVELIDDRVGDNDMSELDEVVANTVDASHEKHVPVIENKEDGFMVRVGSDPHPMEEAHYIMWIELRGDSEVQRKYLKPGDKPEAEFRISGPVVAYIYCNLHGLWKSA